MPFLPAAREVIVNEKGDGTVVVTAERSRAGCVYGITKPIHPGKLTHIWEIRIYTEQEKLVSISRVTIAVLDTMTT